MNPTSPHIERAAFAIYRNFIAGAVGTCRVVRDEFGNEVRETPDDAALRRWLEAPELTRQRFRADAVAALEAAA